MPAETFRVIWDYWLWSSENLSHCKQGDSRLSLRSLFNQYLRSSNGFYSTVLLRLKLLFKLLLLVEKWPYKKFKICRFNVPNTSFHAPSAPLFQVNSGLSLHVCARACARMLVFSSCLQVLQYSPITLKKKLPHQKGVKQYFIICHINFRVPICKALLLIRLTYSVELFHVSLLLTLNKMTSKEWLVAQRVAASTWEVPPHITIQIITQPPKTNKPLLTLDDFVSGTCKDVQVCQVRWPPGDSKKFKRKLEHEILIPSLWTC